MEYLVMISWIQIVGGVLISIEAVISLCWKDNNKQMLPQLVRIGRVFIGVVFVVIGLVNALLLD